MSVSPVPLSSSSSSSSSSASSSNNKAISRSQKRQLVHSTTNENSVGVESLSFSSSSSSSDSNTKRRKSGNSSTATSNTAMTITNSSLISSSSTFVNKVNTNTLPSSSSNSSDKNILSPNSQRPILGDISNKNTTSTNNINTNNSNNNSSAEKSKSAGTATNIVINNQNAASNRNEVVGDHDVLDELFEHTLEHVDDNHFRFVQRNLSNNSNTTANAPKPSAHPSISSTTTTSPSSSSAAISSSVSSSSSLSSSSPSSSSSTLPSTKSIRRLGALLTEPPYPATHLVLSYLTVFDLHHNVRATCRNWLSTCRRNPLLQCRLSPLRSPAFQDLYCSFRSLRTREKHINIIDYLPLQREYTSTMRSVLHDWMLQVNQEFQNDGETIALAVKIADGYFSKTLIVRPQIQLVGIAAVLLASKLIETHYPDLNDLLYLCDGIYTRNQLLQMERQVMQKLNVQLQVPGVLSFSRILLSAWPMSPSATVLVQYLSECTLLNYSFSQLSSSLISTAIYIFVAFHLNNNKHVQEVIEFAGYSRNQLRSIISLLETLSGESHTMDQQHLRLRYSRDDRHRVSSLQFDNSCSLHF